MVYDVVVVGAGPGGAAAAKEAFRLGLNVALVNGGKIGGTCLNSGCMPTKALYEAVNKGWGFDKSIDHAREVVKILFERSSKLRDFPFDFFDNKAKLISDNKVTLDDDSVLEGKFVILATGSSPRMIEGVSKDKLITNENFLELRELPQKLAIVGGGYIGIEFANIFSKLGSKVEIFEMSDTILGTEDKDCLRDVRKSLEEKGVKINLNFKFIDSGFDKVLVAIGRIPNTSSLDADLDLAKGVKVNSLMKSEISWLYSVGDSACLPYRLAHVAEEEGKIAARNIALDLGVKDKSYFLDKSISVEMDYSCIPTRVFSDPLITSIGKQEVELERNSYLVGRAWFKANGMPYCADDTRGFVKVLIDKKTHRFLGAVSLGKIDLHEIGVAIKGNLSAEKIVNLIHFHPGYQEILKEAVENALKNE